MQIRPASKAEAVGLHEGDVLVAVNNIRCRGLSHITTTALMDLHPHLLTVHVLRSVVSSSVRLTCFNHLQNSYRHSHE